MFCIRSLHFCMPCWISTCPATRTRSSQPWCKERHCFAFPFFLGASGFQTCLVAFSEIQLPYAVPSFYFLREVVLHLTNRIAARNVFLIATVTAARSDWLSLKHYGNAQKFPWVEPSFLHLNWRFAWLEPCQRECLPIFGHAKYLICLGAGLTDKPLLFSEKNWKIPVILVICNIWSPGFVILII